MISWGEKLWIFCYLYYFLSLVFKIMANKHETKVKFALRKLFFQIMYSITGEQGNSKEWN